MFSTPTLPTLLTLGLLLGLGTRPALGQCRDPWIGKAYQEVAGRAPLGTGEACECNIRLYNNGSWNSYEELRGYVRQLVSGPYHYAYTMRGNQSILAVYQGPTYVAVAMLDANGNVIASGGEAIVRVGGAADIVNSGGTTLERFPRQGTVSGLTLRTPGFAFTGGRGLGPGFVNTSGNASLKLHYPAGTASSPATPPASTPRPPAPVSSGSGLEPK